MNKTLLIAGAISLLFAASCRNNDDNALPSDSWVVGGTRYIASATTGTIPAGYYRLTATTGNSSSMAAMIVFDFSSGAAPAAGTYRIVGANPNVTGGSVRVTTTAINNNFPIIYSTTGTDSVDATVTIVNSKVIISMPDAMAVNTAGTDNVKISANKITEQ